MKILKEEIKTHLIYWLFIADLIIMAIAIYQVRSFYLDYTDLLTKSLTKKPISTVLAAETEKPLTMKEWVLNEVIKAGLNPKEVDCLISNESGWNNWQQGVNNNKTTDSGLWQINSLHKDTISLEDRFDYKKATRWAINKRLRDGNWSAWYGFNSCK